MVRSSHWEVFRKKSVLRNFAKFTGKHLCQSLFLNKVAGIRREVSQLAKVGFHFILPGFHQGEMKIFHMNTRKWTSPSRLDRVFFNLFCFFQGIRTISPPEENCPSVRIGVWAKTKINFRVGRQPDNCPRGKLLPS